MKVPIVSKATWEEPEDLDGAEFRQVYVEFHDCDQIGHKVTEFINPYNGTTLCCVAICHLINAEAERRGYSHGKSCS